MSPNNISIQYFFVTTITKRLFQKSNKIDTFIKCIFTIRYFPWCNCSQFIKKKKKCNKPLHTHFLRKKKKIIPISSNLYHVSIQFKSLLLVSSLKCVRQALKKEEEKRAGRMAMNVIDERQLQNHENQSSIKQFLIEY